MPHVAMRATFGYARHHRQDRLLAIAVVHELAQPASGISWQNDCVLTISSKHAYFNFQQREKIVLDHTGATSQVLKITDDLQDILHGID